MGPIEDKPPRHQKTPLEYANLPRPEIRVRNVLIVATIVIAIVSLLVFSLCAWHSPARIANKVHCASNLRHIGQAIVIHANEHGGEFPDSLAELIVSQEISSELFICPNTNDTYATGPTTRGIAENLLAGGHMSYIYCGKGLSSASPPAAVVVYEPLSNHDGDSSNFLFVDGHVESVERNRAQQMISELKAGHNPPPPANLSFHHPM